MILLARADSWWWNSALTRHRHGVSERARGQGHHLDGDRGLAAGVELAEHAGQAAAGVGMALALGRRGRDRTDRSRHRVEQRRAGGLGTVIDRRPYSGCPGDALVPSAPRNRRACSAASRADSASPRRWWYSASNR